MPKAIASQNLIIAIQAISTKWEKPARGGANAVLRNRVPEALKVPEFSASDVPVSYMIHSVSYGVRNNFAEPIESGVSVSAVAPDHLHGVTLDFANDALTVSYQYNASHGAPGRHSRKTEALNLSLGQWGRILHNGRCSWEDYWWYEKHVYNIGLFPDPFRSAFIQTKPTKIFSQMAHLF